MKLRYSSRSKEVEEIEARLKQMTLAYSLDFNPDLLEPSFVDGSKEYLGVDKMNEYLDQLDREKEQWYYCSC
ncbi:MAG: hypothetical protein P1U56_22430 [Saprospiraceae bacterium]|nr:hypothetical protein [Saprospiraceae bacterium]